ncbi:MAG: DUF2284 domain-containing protein [Bacillota bacterium]|jgi:predicted metal-binding protein
MLYEPEIKTVVLPAADYCRDYRDPAQFIEYCKVCPRYHHLWCCPPFDFDTTEALAGYRYAYIVGVRATVNPTLRELITDPVTIGEMAELITKDCRRFIDPVILALEQKSPGALAFYGGRCYLCEYCARLTGKPCRHPDRMRSSLESYGFDVARTTEELLGFELEWSNERLPGRLSFIGAVFTREPLTL